MELLFFNSEKIFFDTSGKLREEPEESLDKLLNRYEECCKAFSDFKRREKVAAAKYTRERWINNIEPKFIEDNIRNYGHRTWANAEWSDITIAVASDMSSPGEITTKKAAGPRYVGFQLPEDFMEICKYPNPKGKLADKLIHKVITHPHFKKDGLKLNIAGNSQISLDKAGISTATVRSFLQRVLNGLLNEGIKFAEIRSGGQTGVDEAGIQAAQHLGLKCSILAPKDFRLHYKQGVEIEGLKQFTDRFRETYIDYDAWSKEDENGSFDWSLKDFNVFNGIDMLEYDIDLKIMHINLLAGGDIDIEPKRKK